MFPLEATRGIITIPVESEDGGSLDVFQYMRFPKVSPAMREHIILIVKGPRGGNRYILWLTPQEANSLKETLAQILAQEVTNA